MMAEYKRIGRCIPSKCGALCCRLGPMMIQTSAKKPDKFLSFFGWKELKIKDKLVYTSGQSCKHLEGIGCKVRKCRPDTCKRFPVSPNDGYWNAVKHKCSYRFVKIKSKKPTTEIKMKEEK